MVLFTKHPINSSLYHCPCLSHSTMPMFTYIHHESQRDVLLYSVSSVVNHEEVLGTARKALIAGLGGWWRRKGEGLLGPRENHVPLHKLLHNVLCCSWKYFMTHTVYTFLPVLFCAGGGRRASEGPSAPWRRETAHGSSTPTNAFPVPFDKNKKKASQSWLPHE